MAQDVALWGVAYTDVPEVRVPKQGGGMAAFYDVSDTTAAAADVAQGKLFHTADGTLTTGTASGGGGKAVQYRYGVGTAYTGGVYKDSKLSITVEKTGTYNIMCSCARANGGSVSNYGVQIYVNDSPVGSVHNNFIANNAYGMLIKESGISLTAGDRVSPYYKSTSSYSISVFNLILQEI